MADADVRELERRWRETPTDQQALTALVSALRRSGRPVPLELLEARVLPARVISASWKYHVGAVLPDGGVVDLGTTRPGKGLELPACRWWWLEVLGNVKPDDRRQRALFKELGELRPPALRLTITGCRGGGSVIAALPHVERLRIAGHAWFDDDDVAALTAMSNLVELELVECSTVTPQSLGHIGKMTGLLRLVLDRCPGIGDRGLEALNDLSSLASLDLRRTTVRGPGLERLRLPHLRRLGLRACPIEALPLRHLTGLEELDLSWCQVLRDEVRAGEAVRVRWNDPRIRLDWLGGVCPVQGEGEVNGVEFYFRARGRHWSFTVGPDHAPLFDVEEEWGDGPYDAGYMEIDAAERLVLRCADEYLRRTSVL